MKLYKLRSADGSTSESEYPGRLGGNLALSIYGQLDCWSAKKALAKGGYAKHRVFFKDEQTAIAGGFRPCAKCMRARYKLWNSGGDVGTEAYPWLQVPARFQ